LRVLQPARSGARSRLPLALLLAALALSAAALVLAVTPTALPAALHPLLHLLALLLGEHRLRVTHGRLRVLLDLLARGLALLAEAAHGLALLLGELRALGALAALARLGVLAGLARAAHLGEAGRTALRLQALHQRAVLGLHALLDGGEALHLRVGQVELLPARDQRLQPAAAATRPAHPAGALAALVLPVLAALPLRGRSALLRRQHRRRARDGQHHRNRTNLHLANLVGLGVILQPLIRLRYI
jgi:hypothetical protein